MVFRTRSPRLVDAFANAPDIRPTIEPGTGRVSTAAVVDNPENIVIAGDGGYALFRPLPEGGVYDGHIALRTGHRGAEGLAFGKAALAELFGTTEASKVVAKVPICLPAAQMYVRKLGFSADGEDGAGHMIFVLEK